MRGCTTKSASSSTITELLAIAHMFIEVEEETVSVIVVLCCDGNEFDSDGDG